MKAVQVIFSAVFLVTVVAMGCGGGSKDPVIAEVGSKKITASTFSESYLMMKPDERPDLSTLEGKRKFLDDLINKEVMEMAAFERYPELVERQKYRLKRYREKELTSMATRALIRSQVPVTEEMKDRTYKNMSRERHLRAMLIVDPDEADYVLKKLNEGEEFGSLAKDHSVKWVSDVMEGDLGWRGPGIFPYPVDIAAWEGEVGSIVGPIRMPMGSYLVQILDERPAEPSGSREDLDGLIEQKLMEPLYLNRQKGVQDSLKEYAAPYFSAEAKALLMMKFHFELPEEYAASEFGYLDAERVMPTFTSEEEQLIVVDFKNGQDWTAKDFCSRLSWYPGGLWPRGHTESQLIDTIDMMLRDYLYVRAADDLGFDDDEFKAKLALQAREMRVTFFYYNDLTPAFEPDEDEIANFYEANREAYRAPPSYKLAFFGTRTKQLLQELVADWKAGTNFLDLRAKYEARDKTLITIGESEWLYEGDDFVRDNTVATLKEGGISEVITRSDITMVFKLIARRPSRLLPFAEIKDQVADDASKYIVDGKLTAFLLEKRQEQGVKIFEKVLENLSEISLTDKVTTE